jgi:hypothetical protein
MCVIYYNPSLCSLQIIKPHLERQGHSNVLFYHLVEGDYVIDVTAHFARLEMIIAV